MGKLHKLRRAIEKNPGEWYYDDRWLKKRMIRSARVYKWKGQWYCKPRETFYHDYQVFVKSVLRELGL
jgi:hypothetical protein